MNMFGIFGIMKSGSDLVINGVNSAPSQTITVTSTGGDTYLKIYR